MTTKAKELFGFNWVNLGLPDRGVLNSLNSVIKLIEAEIKDKNFDNVLIPSPYQHQDHIGVNMAMRAVLRPNKCKYSTIYEYPYWSYYQFEENTIRKVKPEKYAILSVNKLEDWESHVKQYNQYLGSKHNLDGHYEGFKLIRNVIL